MTDHILIVEDEADLRECLSDALRLEGHEVVAVEHGEAALRYLSGGARPCLILLDLMMPVMDGQSFREAMLRDATLADIPVVLITAAGEQRASAVRVNRVLKKPLNFDVLMNVVESFCPALAPSGA